MNEQILKLSKEAGSVADATYAKGPDAIWLREYNKKFAELIVRACADVLHQDVEIMPELGGYAHDMVVNMGFKYE